MSSGLERRTILSLITEPVERSPIRSTELGAECFTATAAGSVNSTIATLRLTATSAASYVGSLLHCLGPVSSSNYDQWVEITAFDTSTDTLFHEDFSAATATSDEFEIVKPPDPIVVESTGGATNPIATGRAGDGTDYWKDQYLVCRTSDNNASGSTSTKITAFDSDTGEFTADFSANTAVGDLYHLRHFPKIVGNPTFKLNYGEIPNVTQRGDFSAEANVPGVRSWTAGFSTAIKGSGTAAGNGTAASRPPEAWSILNAIMSSSVTTGTSCSHYTNSGVDHIAVNSGSGYIPCIGQFIMDSNGRMSVVTASLGGTAPIAINPSLKVTPLNGDTIYAGVAFAPMVTGHKTTTVEIYKGGISRATCYGGIPKITIDGFKRGSIPKLTVNYEGGFFYELPLSIPAALKPVSLMTTVVPHDAKNNVVILGASTVLNLIDAKLDLGIETVNEEFFTLPDGTYGKRITGFSPTIQVTAKLDTVSPSNTWAELKRYMNKATFSLFVQHGKLAGNTFGIYAHKCEWSGPNHGADSNLSTISFTAKVLASDLTGMGDLLLGYC